MTTRTWWIVGALALSVVALAFVIYGALTHSNDAGLLRVCWDDDGHAHYSACPAQTEDLLWDRQAFPLDVRLVMNQEVISDEEHARHVLQGAIDEWNSQLGFEAFRLTAGEPGEVNLIWGSISWESNDGGATSHYRMGGAQLATVHIFAIYGADLPTRVVFHELGHVIGLAHDNFQDSPMFPAASDNWEEDFFDNLTLSHYDVDLLRKHYAPSL